MKEKNRVVIANTPGPCSAEKKRLAMYVIYDKDGILDGFRKYYLQEIRKCVNYILAVVCGSIRPECRDELSELADEVIVRENKGLLAGAWVSGIRHIGWDKLSEYDELFMLNDSFFGPIYPLQDMIDAMEESDADFYGAMKNFEEKSYKELAGRPLKHGHFRGSICYFYIIKERLLHSPEFKKYWSKTPQIKENWDTYFYAEIDFYDYVVDCGFRVDAYQGDKLKGYFFDNLTQNMLKLIGDEKIPFARIRPFCTDMQDQMLSIGYGFDPRHTLEYIDKHTDYDVNYIWDYILRAKNLTHIWKQLQLEYVVSKTSIEQPYTYDKQIAVILHIYYTDEVERLANYCENFPQKTKFYITTIKEETKQKIAEEFDKRSLDYILKTRPNVGVAMSTLWITYADIVTSNQYEYICYFHDKKSPYSQFLMQGDLFARRCYENLIGSKAIVKNIINLFIQNPRMGILGAPMPYNGEYYAIAYKTWSSNYDNTVELAEKLGIHVNIDPNIMPITPYGDMFWFRAEALKKTIGHGFTYDDFDIKYERDSTILHAIERVYAFAAQDSGYYYADVINSDEARTDLINYQSMNYTFDEILMRNGQWPGSFEWTKTIIDYHIKDNTDKQIQINAVTAQLEEERHKSADAVKNWQASIEYSELIKSELEKKQHQHAETVENWKSALAYIDQLKDAMASVQAQYESQLSAARAELEEQKRLYSQVVGSKCWKLVHPMETMKNWARRR